MCHAKPAFMPVHAIYLVMMTDHKCEFQRLDGTKRLQGSAVVVGENQRGKALETWHTVFSNSQRLRELPLEVGQRLSFMGQLVQLPSMCRSSSIRLGPSSHTSCPSKRQVGALQLDHRKATQIQAAQLVPRPQARSCWTVHMLPVRLAYHSALYAAAEARFLSFSSRRRCR